MGDICHLVFFPDIKCAKSETSSQKGNFHNNAEISDLFEKYYLIIFKALDNFQNSYCLSLFLLATRRAQASPAGSAQLAHGECTVLKAWRSGLGSLFQRFTKVGVKESKLWVCTRGHSCHAEVVLMLSSKI